MKHFISAFSVFVLIILFVNKIKGETVEINLKGDATSSIQTLKIEDNLLLKRGKDDLLNNVVFKGCSEEKIKNLPDIAKRFLRYVQIDTTSDMYSTTNPTTERQIQFAKMLKQEFEETYKDTFNFETTLSENGHVYIKVFGRKSQSVDTLNKDIPVFGFVAHMDTSAQSKGSNIRPIVHCNYKGGYALMNDQGEEIVPLDDLSRFKHQEDIITSHGDTLLGSDDKSGVAAIFDLMNHLPETMEQAIYFIFTPDEEVGRGVHQYSLNDPELKFAYTVDGLEPGTYNIETFNARSAFIKIKGRTIHTCCAKDRLINAQLVASDFIQQLPLNQMPETTEKRESFLFLNTMSGNSAEVSMHILLRSFDQFELNEMETFLENRLNATMKKWNERFLSSSNANTPLQARYELEVKKTYYNMGDIISEHPELEESILKVYEKLNLEKVERVPIRGGTDGSIFAQQFKLPVPNIFAAQNNPHSPSEHIAIEELVTTRRVLAELINYWHRL
mmetsp:Transcript_3017/g.4428  ORF Transcript_3017/g.4428 Transcript_3017/m.4428 type:complete len:502 (-) Transcript_3017:75-1580(-)